jgi:DNA (cytosine-5)-methyltransferase 1
MKLKRTIKAADLFCGAGGTSTGLLRACKKHGHDVDLIAINHWDVAIATHSTNHPGVKHLCKSVHSVDPLKVVPGGYLDLLWASPECTHHSRARGGKPRSDQSRASAWHVLDWLEDLHVENVIIENVPEFMEWGPLGADGKPLKSKKGELFNQFIANMRALNYTVDHRIVCCAHYGDPTTRERLFIIGRRGRKKITWPEPTHMPAGEHQTFFKTYKQWRSAREIIDWTRKGKSIFARKKPLSGNTMKRIMSGLQKFNGPFIMHLTHPGSDRTHNLARPLPTITGARRGELGLVEPFIIQTDQTGSNGGCARSIDRPVPTLVTKQNLALIEPMIIGQQSGSAARPVSQPLPTIAGAGAIALVEFLVKYYNTGAAVSVDQPLDTITTNDRFALVEPKATKHKGKLYLDILFRMLEPAELARGQGFPDDYQFTGRTKEDIVKQIGNAVPCNTAEALCNSVLD